jgi:hypothetical protein
MHRKYMNLEVARPTTAQVANCRFGVVKGVRQNLLQNPASTDVLCISCRNVIHCSKVTKRVWCS